MAYIGNTPDVGFFTLGVEKFSGTGACTDFTLGRTISDANTISVIVSGVPQVPGDSYSVVDNLLTFTEAPSSSANNIVVTYLATSIYTQYIPGQFAPGSVTQTALALNSVTSEKILNGTIQTVDLAEGLITGNLIANNSVSGNNIVPLAITGNLIANNAVSGNNIVSPPDIFDDAFLFGGM